MEKKTRRGGDEVNLNVSKYLGLASHDHSAWLPIISGHEPDNGSRRDPSRSGWAWQYQRESMRKGM